MFYLCIFVRLVMFIKRMCYVISPRSCFQDSCILILFTQEVFHLLNVFLLLPRYLHFGNFEENFFKMS